MSTTLSLELIIAEVSALRKELAITRQAILDYAVYQDRGMLFRALDLENVWPEGGVEAGGQTHD